MPWPSEGTPSGAAYSGAAPGERISGRALQTVSGGSQLTSGAEVGASNDVNF